MLQDIDPVTIRPMPGKVLLKPDPLPTTTSGGILIPDMARVMSVKNPAHTAIVLAVGALDFNYTEEGKQKRYNADPLIVPGARVVYRLLLNELNEPVILADLRRVDAVIEG